MLAYIKTIRVFLPVLLLTGCATHIGLKNPDNIIEDRLKLSEKKHWLTGTQTNHQAYQNNNWLTGLDDARLIDYVDIALKNNNNLLASAANVQASIYAARLNNNKLYPAIDFAVNRTKTETENIAGDTNYISVYDGNFSINWELDIWRKLSNQKKSAVLNTDAQIANYQAAQLSLVANVAKTWFTINTNQLQLDLAKQRLESQLSTLSVVEEQYKNGTLSAREVYLNRTDVETQKANILDVEQNLENSIRTFKRLLGQYPNIDLDFSASLPELTTDIPGGLPSELLTRRPDIIASRAQWQSSKFNAKAAHKARFPSFSLTARYGASSNELSQLDKQTLLWNIISNLSLPLFRGGALKAQAKQAAFQADAALYNYIDTLLVSFAEVENTLSNEQRLKLRLTATQQSAFFAQSGYELALDRKSVV